MAPLPRDGACDSGRTAVGGAIAVVPDGRRRSGPVRRSSDPRCSPSTPRPPLTPGAPSLRSIMARRSSGWLLAAGCRIRRTDGLIGLSRGGEEDKRPWCGAGASPTPLRRRLRSGVLPPSEPGEDIDGSSPTLLAAEVIP